MYKITRDIILDVNNPSTQGTITIQQGTADAYRIAMHITAGGHPVDLSDSLVQIKAVKPDSTEIYDDCDSGRYSVLHSSVTVCHGGWLCRLPGGNIRDGGYFVYA